MITVLELPQGYYADLTGMRWDEAVQMMLEADAAFVAKYPSTQPYHHPSFHERNVAETATAPWGYEWYIADADDRLRLHSACYDSSG